MRAAQSSPGGTGGRCQLEGKGLLPIGGAVLGHATELWLGVKLEVKFANGPVY